MEKLNNINSRIKNVFVYRSHLSGQCRHTSDSPLYYITCGEMHLKNQHYFEHHFYCIYKVAKHGLYMNVIYLMEQVKPPSYSQKSLDIYFFFLPPLLLPRLLLPSATASFFCIPSSDTFSCSSMLALSLLTSSSSCFWMRERNSFWASLNSISTKRRSCYSFEWLRCFGNYACLCLGVVLTCVARGQL